MARFVPRDFELPVPLATDRFRLRPITIHDVVKDYEAVMTSKEHLRASLPWGWPSDDLTLEQTLIDLGWHHREWQMKTSFDFAVMSPDETRLLGCVYVDPPDKAGYDAEVTWWVRADDLGTGLDEAVGAAVRPWLAERWPFARPGYPGRDIPWDEWDALPDRDG